MKLNTVLLAGLVSIGLLTIGANSAFAGGYSSARNAGGLRAASSYRLAPMPANAAWERDNAWASYTARNLRVAPNREPVGSRNGFVPSPASQIGTIRRQEVVPRRRDPNPPAAARPVGVPAQGPQRDSAEINTQRSKIGSQHLSANPAAPEASARINEKFQRYENKFASDPRISADRRESLNRARGFLLNLIDLGYTPLIVDSWCDDLLNDQIDDGMPMDLVDAYWGQPVDTQGFVEYYVPYEVCTYRTADGDYRQVTYKNRVVSRPTSNVANVRTR